MNINTNNMVSISEANQNFSKVAKKVDENGSVIIMKNNRPKYILIEFNEDLEYKFTKDEAVVAISEKIIEENKIAYKELAK